MTLEDLARTLAEAVRAAHQRDADAERRSRHDLERRVASLRDSLAAATAEPAEALRAAEAGAKHGLAEIERLQHTLAELRIERDCAEARVREHVSARRARTEDALARVETVLHQALRPINQALVDEAQEWLGAVAKEPPVLLRQQLGRHAWVSEARRDLVRRFQEADARLARHCSVEVEATATREHLVALADKEARLRVRLLSDHEVEATVISALFALPPGQLDVYMRETLDPRSHDARAESGWGLPFNVLEEVKDGS